MNIFDNIHLMYFRSDSSIRKGLTRLRTTNQYEMEFYTTENGISFINDKEYRHAVGNVVIARPGYRRQSKNYFECYAIHFQCNDKLFAGKYLDVLPPCVYFPQCKEAFHELIHSNMTNERSRNLCSAAGIIKILSMLHEAYHFRENSCQKNDASLSGVKHITKITEYIKSNYSQNINVNELYKSEYMCRSSFFKLFKEVTGKTPNNYINTVRIENSKILLDTTELPIAVISKKCGFESQAYFDCVFKQITGISPMQYRKTVF